MAYHGEQRSLKANTQLALWNNAGFVLMGGVTYVVYFVYVDLGGFVHLVPGTVMTLISGAVVILSVIVFVTTMTPKGDY